jgi:hypothetical protein
MAASRLRTSEIHRRPTPHPGFDVAKFARDSERKMCTAAAVDKTPTGPPPPYHPASMAPAAAAAKDATVVPAALDAHLREGKSRIALVRGELAVGNLSREEATSVLRVELRAIAASARGAEAEALVAWLGELGGVIEEIGGIGAFLHGEPLRVFVVDEDAALRDRIALAIESLGNTARTGASLRELAVSANVYTRPDVVIVAAALAGEQPEPGFADVVRELARSEGAQVIVYTTAAQSDLAAIARERGARQCFCPASSAVDALAAQLAPIFEEISW